MTAMRPEPDHSSQEGVAAAVRLLHRRHGWTRVATTSVIAFLLGTAAAVNAASQGTPAPSWFLDLVIALGALAAVSIVAAVADTARLRRTPPAVRAQAVPIAARHPRPPQARHYPPRHLLTWALAWLGMLVLLVMAVVSAPAVVDGPAYLAGAGARVTFDPTSYSTYCSYRYGNGCQTITDGTLETGGAGVSASWQSVVPLGRPFPVRAPVWRWGLGLAMIDSDETAVIALVIGLLVEGAAVVVLVELIRLARNWRQHRHRRIWHMRSA